MKQKEKNFLKKYTDFMYRYRFYTLGAILGMTIIETVIQNHIFAILDAACGLIFISGIFEYEKATE